ncbi:MAG: flagellar export protein FliJ [SAR324 cluster bacterium]|nr:flagellar export protein FliJ [SAR324 cluster bacterium]
MFTFSLQTVLDVRERLEKIKYKEFSGLLFERQRMDGEIRARNAQISGAAEKLDLVRRNSITAAPLQLYTQFRQRLQSEIGLIAEQLREEEQALEEKRKELVEARRAHRALEILKEKERARYAQALARQERAIMDEIAANNYLHQK